jgi:hypothetical protein
MKDEKENTGVRSQKSGEKTKRMKDKEFLAKSAKSKMKEYRIQSQNLKKFYSR